LALRLHLNRIATPLVWKLPLSQCLLARLTFGQVFYWTRPEDIISKCGEIEVVNQSAHEGLTLGGLTMGLEGGPSGGPVALSRRPTASFCTIAFIPYRVVRRHLFAPSHLYPIASSDGIFLHHRTLMEVVSLRLKSHINGTIKCLSRRAPAILHPSIPKDYRRA
jgi:hypothetical protein